MTGRALLVVLVLAGIAGADAPPKGDQPEGTPAPEDLGLNPKLRYAPDPRWRPVQGARGHVLLNRTPACTDIDVFRQADKVYGAKDAAGADELVKSGQVFEASHGTPFLVLRDLQPPNPTAGMVVPLEQYNQFVLANIAASANAPKYPIEVRFLAGPLAGKALLVPREKLGVLVPIGKAKVKPGKADAPTKPAPEPATAITRAATLLRSAQSLEKAKKTRGALDFYKQIVKDFKDTPEAKTAAARIKALGGK